MSTANELADALIKRIGKNDSDQEVLDWLDTGFPPLNRIISGLFAGGLPYGRIIEVYGPSSSGKTALASAWMIEAQQKGGVAVFMDHERSFDVGMAQSMGLNVEFPWWVYRRPETWESSNALAIQAADELRKAGLGRDKPIIVVFDSVASMIPHSMLYDAKNNRREIDTYTMNDTTALSRVTSTTLKVVKSEAARLNITFIYLNQTRTKLGVLHGDPTTTPGGMAMEFYADARLSLGRRRVLDADKDFVAQDISIEAKKTKFTRPFQETTLRLGFRENGSAYFDTVFSAIEALIERGDLKISGPRVGWTDGKQYFKSALAEKIRSENLKEQLFAMFKD